MDGWLLFGKSGSNWVLESTAGPMAVPSDAVVADEIDRKYRFVRDKIGGIG